MPYLSGRQLKGKRRFLLPIFASDRCPPLQLIASQMLRIATQHQVQNSAAPASAPAAPAKRGGNK
jgi:hypothetical protein